MYGVPMSYQGSDRRFRASWILKAPPFQSIGIEAGSTLYTWPAESTPIKLARGTLQAPWFAVIPARARLSAHVDRTENAPIPAADFHRARPDARYEGVLE